ncbi:hypothetical protein NKH18_16655 [Streptomyces sp. M10(2022)]
MLAAAERNRRIAEESGLPVFVTTPDLLVDLPTAIWTPLSWTWMPGPATSRSWSASARSCCTCRPPAGRRARTGCSRCWRTWTGAR